MAFFTKRYHAPGTPPGTLSTPMRIEAPAPRIQVINYTPDAITARDGVEASDCRAYLDSAGVTWVHVAGRPSQSVLEELGEVFGLHALALEDVMNSGQRPKVESFEDQLFVVMALPLMQDDLVSIYQASFFLGESFVVSFCDHDAADFQPVVDRLHSGGIRIRHKDADFLLYSLLDLVIDSCFPVLEDFGLQLEDVEEEILEAADKETLERIHVLKRELIFLRRMLWPEREVISQLQRGQHGLIREETSIYLRDCYDHVVQVMELLETYREMAGGMMDIFLSSLSNRMNDVMRVLTVIATMFIPLTFIVGVYGMNFDPNLGPWSMPELRHPLGYLSVWLVMIVLVVGMLVFFRRRKWI